MTPLQLKMRQQGLKISHIKPEPAQMKGCPKIRYNPTDQAGFAYFWNLNTLKKCQLRQVR